MVTKENFTCTVHSHVIYLLGILYPFPAHLGTCISVVPDLSGIKDGFHGRQFFHRLGEGGGGWFQKIQTHNIYCALYFYYYYIVVYIEIITQLTVMQN